MSVFLLCASVLLGGGTRAGVLGDVLLQFISVPFLLAALWLWADRLGAQGDWRDRMREPQVLLGCAFAGLGGLILLAQFVPLFGSVASSGIWNEIARHGGEAAPSGPVVPASCQISAPQPWRPSCRPWRCSSWLRHC